VWTRRAVPSAGVAARCGATGALPIVFVEVSEWSAPALSIASRGRAATLPVFMLYEYDISVKWLELLKGMALAQALFGTGASFVPNQCRFRLCRLVRCYGALHLAGVAQPTTLGGASPGPRPHGFRFLGLVFLVPGAVSADLSAAFNPRPSIYPSAVAPQREVARETYLGRGRVRAVRDGSADVTRLPAAPSFLLANTILQKMRRLSFRMTIGRTRHRGEHGTRPRACGLLRNDPVQEGTMTFYSFGDRVRSACGVTFAALLLAAALPLVAPTAAEAQRPRDMPAAQAQRQQLPPREAGYAAPGPVKAEFRAALEPYGRWQRHARWGEVWTPADRPRDWRPYTVGRWAYTDDWGWYWVSDEPEARWGWVAYHYGRWMFDDDLGWCWVPGDEWSPAWVQWRRARQGFDYVGWAPLPPDDLIVEYVDEPRFWIFVRGPDFIAPRILPIILPVARYNAFINETVIVNRTVLVAGRGGRFAVNPGISPAEVAAVTRRPLRTYDVRPTVLAGTAPIAGAVQVRPQDLGRRNFRPQAALRETQNVVRPADRVRPAQPLAADARGRLGDRPPRAAQRGAEMPTTASQAPADRQPVQPQEKRQQGQEAQRPQEQQRQQDQQEGQQRQPSQQQGRAKKQESAQPQGAGEPQRAMEQSQRARRQQQQQQGARPQRQAPTAQEQRPATEGRGRVEQRQPQTERRAVPPQRQQAQRPKAESSAPAQRPPATHGRGGGGPAQAAPQLPRAHPGGTEGRGGGGGGPPRAAPSPAPHAPSGGPGAGGPGGGPGGGKSK